MNRSARCSTLLLILCLTSSLALAIDGGTLRIHPEGDWEAFEVITQGEDAPGDGFTYAMPGIFDGAGAWLAGPNTLRIQVNHETGDASISEVDLDLANLITAIQNSIATGDTGGLSFVTAARQAYGRWSNNGGASFINTSNNSNTSFGRFCSGQAYAPDTFGPGRGFVDQVYLTGEEISNGRMFVLDSVNRDFYRLSGVTGEAPGGIGGMPNDSWENNALVDTGESDHIALLLAPDGGSEQMKIYVGEKGRDVDGNSSSSFLARNGLAYGSWYYLNASLPGLGNTNNGTFDTSSSGSLESSKLEDVDTSPDNPSQVVLGDQNSGVFTFDFNLVFNGGFDAGASSFTLTKIANEGGFVGSLDSPDNLDWTRATQLGANSYPDGLVYINEDNSTGEIWQVNADGSNQIKIASTTVFAESTGIFDLSEFVGYVPGSVLLTNNQGSPASMTVLIHPDATVAQVPAGGDSGGLLIDRSGATELSLQWQPSCSIDDDDYAVYTGQICSYPSHTLELCGTSGATSTVLPLPAGSRYYLVVPLEGGIEGSYGRDSSGSERTVGASTCAPQELEPDCP